jgi:hypothetical protein
VQTELDAPAGAAIGNSSAWRQALAITTLSSSPVASLIRDYLRINPQAIVLTRDFRNLLRRPAIRPGFSSKLA